VPHITDMIDDDLFLLTEVDVAGTWMDPAYMLRYWEETRGALWVWAEWAQPMYGQYLNENGRAQLSPPILR